KKEKWFQNAQAFDKKINVPFAYQSNLSGIDDPSFCDHVWYRRSFKVQKEWQEKQIILHFGAVDYRAWVYINGKFAGYHEGGHTSFSCNITEFLNWEKEEIVVKVEDPSTDETIPRGKQFWKEQSEGIWYTRTTGIWQTVWMEPVNEVRIEKLRLTPDVDEGEVKVEFNTTGDFSETKAEIEISFK